jgi:hypothetical protein
MRSVRTGERGNVVVTAIFVIGVMMAIGLAAMARVDTQSRETGTERVRESTFNLGEAALSSQIFVLGRRGTGTASTPYPAECPSAGAEYCPDDAKLMLNYDKSSQVDFDPAETEWRTWVRDNAAGTVGSAPDTFWTDSLLTTRPRYDQNADRLMWVRAEATVRDRTRAMVGLIRIEDRPVAFPNYAILSGKFRTTNNGKHSDAIVNATGSLGVQVRCSGAIPSSSCLDYKPNQGQIVPPNLVATGYSGSAAAISGDDLDALMDVARANNTYFTSCPGSLTGEVVVIDTTASCDYQGNSTYNTPNNPGLVILTRGKLEIRGTVNFNGLIYHANLGGSADWDMVKVHGNSQLMGGVIVDGNGGVESGSSGKQNLVYAANAFNNITTFGTAGVVQNTWREIRPLN